MKKFTLILIAAILAVVTLTAQAQSGQTLSFLNGYNLAIPNNATQTAGTSTNTYAKGFTVTNSASYPYVSAYSPIYVTNTAAFVDVPLWANRDGTAPICNISVDVVGPIAQFTNVLTFTFAAIPAVSSSPDFLPVTFRPANQSQNQFVFTVTGNGTTDVVLSTNVPSSVLQGARAMRLLSIASSASGTNGTVVFSALNGYKPPGNE